MKNSIGLLVASLVVAWIAVTTAPASAGRLQVSFAEAGVSPAGVSQYCGECHDGVIAAFPKINRVGSHPVDRGGLTCLSCHRSADPKKTPWRCAECHEDILYGARQNRF